MLRLGQVEMITWQTHQADEKLATVQEAAILSFLLLENTRGPSRFASLHLTAMSPARCYIHSLSLSHTQCSMCHLQSLMLMLPSRQKRIIRSSRFHAKSMQMFANNAKFWRCLAKANERWDTAHHHCRLAAKAWIYFIKLPLTRDR